MIGSGRCPITGVQLQPTVRLEFCRLIRAKYSSLCTNYIFYENCMVVINQVIVRMSVMDEELTIVHTR